MVDRRRIATNCGLVAPAVAVGAIVLATVVAPPETFTWRGRALSDMGRPGTTTFALFNGGLIAAGALGGPFVWRVWIETRNGLQRAGAVALGASLVGMIGVGVFFLEHTEYYLSTSLHAPAALLTFGAGPIAALLYGLGALRAGENRLAASSILSAAIPVGTWIGWVAFLRTLAAEPGVWFAVPEFVAASCLGGWVVVLAIAYRTRETVVSRP
ncbi:DUF998 domain-containing protein [Halovivax cerinus]|uniref:DUF998 domain-containing protein n=1 Tax=Halovivax cerinus TaxID=1487865 RepID=A0ABD5NIR5_9EURY|nr:DUF998 domain-containing protein [Halovivax cerinus]